MKKAFLFVFLLAFVKPCSSQLDETLSAGVALTYNRILNVKNNNANPSPGINVRISGNLGKHHMLVAGYSYFLPTTVTYTAYSYPRNYYATGNQFNYTEYSRSKELFLDVFHLIGNENTDKFAFYFHTGVNISFYQETIKYVNMDTVNSYTDVKESKTKRSALYVYVGCGLQYKIGPGYLFLEPKLQIPVPVGKDPRNRERIPVGISLGYRVCFEDL